MTVKEIAKLLKKEKKVALFIHTRPDGDAIGCSLALKNFLEKNGIETDLYCEDDIPKTFAFLNADKYFKKEIDGEYSALVALDSADVFRIGDFCGYFSKHKNTFNIDHHVSNTRYAKHNLVIDRGADCENVYEIFKEGETEIDEFSANCLATGIITDTGNLKHNNVTPTTLLYLSELLSLGANLHDIIYNTFTAQSKERAKLFGRTMSELRYYLDDKLCIAFVSEKALAETGAVPSDTEGFIDFIMGIKGLKVGVCIMELEKDKYKASFRSNGTNVNEIAGIFGGGGHVQASGCQYKGLLEEFIDKIVYAVKQRI